MPEPLARRTFLAAAAALPLAAPATGALPLATPAAPAPPPDDRLAATLARLRLRLEGAGQHTVARYDLRGPERHAASDLLRAGHAALSIVPALRRLDPRDLATPAAQALLRDVLEAVGRYALLVHDALDALHVPHHRRALADLHATVATLSDHDTDEEFGRTSYHIVRQARARVRAEGAPAVLASLRQELGQVRASAEATPVADPDPVGTCRNPLDPPLGTLAVVAGALLLGVGLVAGVYAFVIVACAAAYGGPAPSCSSPSSARASSSAR